MGRPFKSGDTVMVVKPEPCCGSLDFLGLVFTVERVATPMEAFNMEAAFCGTCGAETSSVIVWKDSFSSQPVGFYPETLKHMPSDKEIVEEEICEQNPYLKSIKEQVKA